MLSLRAGILISSLAALSLITLIFAGCGDDPTPASPDNDTVAPAVPDGLDGNVVHGNVELLWNANVSDPDLAGYVVFRSLDPGEGFAAITGTVGTNNWTDRAIAPDRTYYYRLSAIDLKGNVSPMSGPMAISSGSSD